MRPLTDIEAEIVRLRAPTHAPSEQAQALLGLAEEVLEHWLIARGEIATEAKREGFRLLALQRQGTRGDPSFNACRETCREIAYHYNLLVLEPASPEAPRRSQLMANVVMHLVLFVTGKLENARFGEFCCSARPLHAEAP